MPDLAQHRTLQATSPAMPQLRGSPALVPLALKGHEALSKLYSYRLILATPDDPSISAHEAAQVDIKALIGKELTVHIELDGRGQFTPGGASPDGRGQFGRRGSGERQLSGLVTQARFLQQEGRRALYEATIEPWLTLATRTSDFRIFQHQSVVQIIQQVLGDYDWPLVLRLSQTYPEQTFQVQYGESDYDFVARLMHEWGIYYFFEHSQGAHRLVLCDAMGAHTPFKPESPDSQDKDSQDSYAQVSYYPPGHKIDEEHLSHFEYAERLQSGQWATGDYDFTAPRSRLAHTVQMPRQTGHNQLERYQWPGDHDSTEGGAAAMKARTGGITHGTAGAWTEYAASHDSPGPDNKPVPMPLMPVSDLSERPGSLLLTLRSHAEDGRALVNEPYSLYRGGGKVADGITDEHGQLVIQDHQKGTAQYTVKLANGHEIELPVKDKLHTDDDKQAAQGLRDA